MTVRQCDMPPDCDFSRDRAKFYYWDSFEACLRDPDLTMTQIYIGIFSHMPGWAKWLLVLRNKIVSVFGIKGPTLEQLNDVGLKGRYVIGEQIALFTLRSQDENEIVAGGDDKHLEFKVSVLRVNDGGVRKVVVTTIVKPHNFFGKAYLFFILPFHRFGVKTLMSKAVAAGRV